MKIEAYVISGPGRKRAANQDNFYLDGKINERFRENPFCMAGDEAEGTALFAVADGMGGEEFGEEAAFIAVSGLAEKPGLSPAMLTAYLKERNLQICDLMKNRENVRIGTTFVSVFVSGETADICNLGDSRAYLYRKDSGLRQLSRDHTVAATLAETGLLSKTEARKAKGGHALTQHLGVFPEELQLEPYQCREQVVQGDIFLLCSDGLTDMLDDRTIETVLSDAAPGPKEKTETLYRLANESGGMDNITALVINLKSVF